MTQILLSSFLYPKALKKKKIILRNSYAVKKKSYQCVENTFPWKVETEILEIRINFFKWSHFD